MMQIIRRAAAVFLVLSVALLAMTLALKRSEASSRAPDPARAETTSKWEYQTIVAKTPEELGAQANQGGAESWEMVSVVHVLNTNRYQWVGFFKRLKQ